MVPWSSAVRRRSTLERDLLVAWLDHLKETEDDPESRDIERSHFDADNALVEFIGDPLVKAAYDRLNRHYA